MNSSQKLSKVIIPIAGLGTRMLPATKAIPKEMLPIVDKPIIQYIVEEAIEAGFKEIIFITHSSKSSVEDHFDTSFELETILENRVKRSTLKAVQKISKLNFMIHSIRQGKTKGLGHAIFCAKSIIGSDAFGIMLPDMILEQSNRRNMFQTMKKNYEKYLTSSILLATAKKNEINKYGIAHVTRKKSSTEPFLIQDIIEKPKIEESPSKFFAVGRYIFSNNFMDYLSKEKPDKLGEIQLTSAISKFVKEGNKTTGYLYQDRFFDCGDKLGYLKAIVEFGKKDMSIGKDFKKFLRKI